MPTRPTSTQPRLSRRGFTGALALGAAAAAATPALARVRQSEKETIIGSGEHTFRVKHHFPQLPDRYTWQTTHNVAVDAAGNLYVIHEGRKEQKDHPAIFVFDAAGKFIRAFGSQFQGGGHGIEVRKEGNGEFLYVCAYQPPAHWKDLWKMQVNLLSPQIIKDCESYAASVPFAAEPFMHLLCGQT